VPELGQSSVPAICVSLAFATAGLTGTEIRFCGQ